MRTRIAPTVGFIVDDDGRNREDIVVPLLLHFLFQNSISRSVDLIIVEIVNARSTFITRTFSHVGDVILQYKSSTHKKVIIHKLG